jgi:hypothetical protein
MTRPVSTEPGEVEEIRPTDPEDLKIIALARAALARSNTGEAACVRDTDGRTYAGVRVELPHLKLSAISVAVAMAVSSGAAGLEAVALAGNAAPRPDDLAVIIDLGGRAVVIWSVDPAGSIRSRITS